MRGILAATLVVLLGAGCDYEIVDSRTPPPIPMGPTTPTPTPPIVVTSRIEYRVSGNAASARIRYSNLADGLSEVITGLPYVIRFSTTDTATFLSLETTAIAYPAAVTFPFLSIQIFVDGFLFREASSTDFAIPTVAASGTWRRE